MEVVDLNLFSDEMFPSPLPSESEEVENRLFPANLYDFLFTERPDEKYIQTMKATRYVQIPACCDPASLRVEVNYTEVDCCPTCKQKWQQKDSRFRFLCTFNHHGKGRHPREIKLSWKQKLLPGEPDMGLRWEARIRLISPSRENVPTIDRLLVEGVLGV